MTEHASIPKPGLRIALFALAYFSLASMTVGLTRFGGGLALVWLSTGVAATMLIALPRERWRSALLTIAAASALATSLFGFGPHMAAPLAAVNTLEAWLVARLLMFSRPGRDWLDDVKGLVCFITLGGIAAPGIAAIFGGTAASFSAAGSWQHHAINWWAGHGLGMLIGFPIAYLVANVSVAELRARATPRGLASLIFHLALVLVVSIMAIAQSALPLLFLPIVPLLLTAFRCGREGAVLGTLVVAGVAVWANHYHTTPIAPLALGDERDIFFFQFYLAIISLMAIPVSIALRQHQLLFASLQEAKALEQLVADHSDDALLNLDESGRIRYASPAGARLSGEDDLVGRALSLFFDPMDEPMVRATLAHAAATPDETTALERPVLCGDEQLWLQAKIRAVFADGRPGSLQGFAVTIRDVTARKRTELDAIAAAETDSLTGLPNRPALMRVLERALGHSHQRPIGVGIIDLDHFKGINDTHGHVAGDDVLREVGAVMQRLSTPGCYFARLGGEEFALVSQARDLAEMSAVCEELRRAVAKLRFTSPAGQLFRVTTSIGLAHVTRRMTPALALHTADALLYKAKHRGRDRVVTSATGLETPRARAA